MLTFINSRRTLKDERQTMDRCGDLAFHRAVSRHGQQEARPQVQANDLLHQRSGRRPGRPQQDILRQFDISAAKERVWVIAERKKAAAEARAIGKKPAAKPAAKEKKK